MNKLATVATVLLVALLSSLAGAQAPTLRVTSPPDRLALPGAFVTLVYRVQSSAAGQARVTIASQHGYTMLLPPGTLELQPGAPAPVPVTVEIPADAPALTVDPVTLTVTLSGARAQGTVRITVGEKRGVAIRAPGQVPVSAGRIPFTLVNQGNVEEKGTLRVTRNGAAVATRAETLGPGASRTVDVAVEAAGGYEATLEVGGQVQARAFVQVAQESVPAPPPLHLHVSVTSSLDTSSNWGFGVKLRGPLSDYLTTQGAYYADNPDASFLTLHAPRWRTSVGSLAPTRLGLGLPSELGWRGTYTPGPWRIGAAATWIGGDRFAGYAFGGRYDQQQLVAGAAGVHAGAPLLAFQASQTHKRSAWSVGADLVDGALTALVQGSSRDRETHGTASFTVQATRLLAPDGTLQAGAGYTNPDLTLYGSVTAPVGAQATGGARGGTVLRLPTPLAGSLFLNLQGGTDQSFATLSYAASLEGGWQTSDAFGTVRDSSGAGVQAATSWTYAAGPQNSLGADAELTYYPASRSLAGRLAARYAQAFGPAAVSLSGGWDVGQSTLGIGSALTWSGASWGVQLTGDAGYDTLGSTFTGSFGLAGHVAFDLTVPEAVVRAAGGRRLGTLEGRVHASAAGIPDVVVRIGPYHVRTGPDGSFEARLPPGRVRVALDLTSLPIQYQLRGAASREVVVAPKRTVRADFPVVSSAALAGRVLLDSNGDGKPDVPAKPGEGTVVLSSGTTGPQVLTVGPDGSFEARGLLPGRATVTLTDLPLGATVEGKATRTVDLRAGAVSRLTYLVEPAAIHAPVFGANSFRILKVQTEVGRVPPGAAPRVTVSVQGHADSVHVQVSGEDVALHGNGGRWSGRIPVPLHARAGVLPFHVVARSGSSTSTRDGQLLVEPGAPAVTASPRGAARTGGTVTIEIVTYLKAEAVAVASPFGPKVSAAETSPGRWDAEVPVPNSAKNEVYTAAYSVTTKDGRTLTGHVRFRVLGR